MGAIGMIVLDTCCLIWYTMGKDDDLSDKAKETIENTTEILVSTISFWEIGIKIKKKEIIFPISLENYIHRLKQADNIRFIPLDEDIIIKSLNLDWEHKDPADRFIVATAMQFEVPLITSDKIIKTYYSKTVW